MQKLYENIRKLRIEKKISQDALAQLTGYKDRSSITKIESGKVDLPQSKILLFAQVLGVTPYELMGFDESEQPHEQTCGINEQPRPRGVRIPVLGKVAAGLPISAVEDVLDWEEIPERLANTGEFFGLRIQGNSMEPRIYDGDVVIVKRQSDAETGSIVIAQVNGDEAFCKRLIKEESGIILQSLNQSYQPFFFTNQEVEEKPVVILGRVVELRGKF